VSLSQLFSAPLSPPSPFIDFVYVDFSQLTHLVKQVSLKVVEDGGIVRSIQNHGIRQLPYKFKAKYPDKEGNRYYKKGRFVSVFYDANPTTQKQVEAILKLDEQVLRNTHLKAVDLLERVNISQTNKNPFIQRVLLDTTHVHPTAETDGSRTTGMDSIKHNA